MTTNNMYYFIYLLITHTKMRFNCVCRVRLIKYMSDILQDLKIIPAATFLMNTGCNHRGNALVSFSASRLGFGWVLKIAGLFSSLLYPHPHPQLIQPSDI